MTSQRRIAILSGIALIAASLVPLSVGADTFSRTLRLGSSGTDVLSLQKILNASTVTQIANAGPGSPGNETSYFGAATQKAVIAFQSEYAADILVPNGLTQGTGIVGPSTIKKLESLSATAVTPPSSAAVIVPTQQQPSNTTVPGDTTASAPVPAPTITSISQTTFGNGDTILIHGTHFTANNTVLVSLEPGSSFTGIPSSDGMTLSATISLSVSKNIAANLKNLPSSTKSVIIQKIITKEQAGKTLQDGWYEPATISVRNANGTSNTVSVNINLLKGI